MGPAEAQRLAVIDKTPEGDIEITESIPVRFGQLETVV
jgi:hypothetical protein